MSMPNQAENAAVSTLAELLEPHRPLHVRYAGGELISREGTFAAGLQWITQGLVMEAEGTAEGGSLSAPPDLLVPGDALGVEILAPNADERHRTTCRALTEVSLIFVDRASLDRALVADAKLAVWLAGHLAERNVRLRRARSRLGLAPAFRLQGTLLELSSICEPVEGEDSLALPEAVDARILGELSGLSPSQMKRLLPDVSQTQDTSGRIVFQLGAARDLRRQSVS